MYFLLWDSCGKERGGREVLGASVRQVFPSGRGVCLIPESSRGRLVRALSPSGCPSGSIVGAAYRWLDALVYAWQHGMSVVQRARWVVKAVQPQKGVRPA